MLFQLKIPVMIDVKLHAPSECWIGLIFVCAFYQYEFFIGLLGLMWVAFIRFASSKHEVCFFAHPLRVLNEIFALSKAEGRVSEMYRGRPSMA